MGDRLDNERLADIIMKQLLSEVEMEAIHELYSKTKEELLVIKLILFGSKARGEAEQYSDVDLLVLTRKEKTREDRKKLTYISADINIDYGIALSCSYYNISEWQSGKGINPQLKENIEKEGVEIALQ